MNEVQIQLQNALTTTFLANLAFLSEYDNDLYHRVDELSRMIENKTYQEKYALDFIMESGDFDIYDIVNDKFLYNKNPKKTNEELIRKVQFDEKNSIFDLSPDFLIKYKYEINRENRFNFKEMNELNRLTQNDMWEYANVTKDFLEDRTKKLKKIEKFIFLGTLEGRHIPEIAKKIDAKIYLVCERNLEIFRLSLFTVDYTILGEKGVIFSIMDNQVDESNKIFNFLNINIFNNYLLKFSTTNINIDKYVDNVLNSLLMSNPTVYDYNRSLYVHLNRTLECLGNNNLKILLFDKIKEKCNFFENIPILYLAAGPSLDGNLDWIRENQNKFFIVTIGAAFKKLLNNNIRIDMITTLDEQEVLSTMQFDDDSISKISKDTIIIASAITSENILKKLYKKNLFIYEVFMPFYKNSRAFSGFSIGEITLNILLNMNAKEIYLIGLDLALNQITGNTHSDGSGSGTSVLDLNKEQERNIFDYRNALLKVKGNFLEEVYTTPIFYSSIKSLEIILSKKENTQIYNLSTHGAYFENTKCLEIEKLKANMLTDVSNKNQELIYFLTQNSDIEVSTEILNSLKKEIFFIKKELKNSLEDFKKIKINKFEDFMHFIEKFSIIKKNNFLILDRILLNYFEIVIPYLIYHFNDNEITNEKKKINGIKRVFVKQMNNILDDYIYCLEKVTKK